MIEEWEDSVDGLTVRRENRSSPAPHYSIYTLYGSPWNRTPASAVRSRQLPTRIQQFTVLQGIYSSLKDVVITLECTTSNGMAVIKQWIGNNLKKKKISWPTWGTILSFAWKDWGKTCITSIRTFCVSAEIRKTHLLNIKERSVETE